MNLRGAPIATADQFLALAVSDDEVLLVGAIPTGEMSNKGPVLRLHSWLGRLTSLRP